jgi:hypothetical protein
MATQGLVSHCSGEKELFAAAIDLSEQGICIERPFVPGPRREGRVIQLEFDVPGIDELVWAKGEICFDLLAHGKTAHRGALVLRTGIQIVAAARRQLALLRELVRWQAAKADLDVDPSWLMRASAYMRG